VYSDPAASLAAEVSVRAAVRRVAVSLIALIATVSCGSDRTPDQRAIMNVPVTARWDFPTLRAPVQVVSVEAGIPHIYAASKRDGWVVMGFLHARDRYVQMELTRRYGQGRIAELVGDAGLSTDLASRGRGATDITARLLEQLDETEGDLLDAYVEGINAYIAELTRTDAPPRVPIPTELPVVTQLVGAETLGDVLAPMTRTDAVSMLTAVLFNSSFTSDDLTRQRALDGLDGHFAGAPNEALRDAGVLADLFDWVKPVRGVTSAAGFGTEGAPLMSANTGARGARAERRARDARSRRANDSTARDVAHRVRTTARTRGPSGARAHPETAACSRATAICRSRSRPCSTRWASIRRRSATL
jgi:hypothetical protein